VQTRHGVKCCSILVVTHCVEHNHITSSLHTASLAIYTDRKLQ
jgi:hypothetical protein